MKEAAERRRLIGCRVFKVKLGSRVDIHRTGSGVTELHELPKGLIGGRVVDRSSDGTGGEVSTETTEIDIFIEMVNVRLNHFGSGSTGKNLHLNGIGGFEVRHNPVAEEFDFTNGSGSTNVTTRFGGGDRRSAAQMTENGIQLTSVVTGRIGTLHHSGGKGTHSIRNVIDTSDEPRVRRTNSNGRRAAIGGLREIYRHTDTHTEKLHLSTETGSLRISDTGSPQQNGRGMTDIRRICTGERTNTFLLSTGRAARLIVTGRSEHHFLMRFAHELHSTIGSGLQTGRRIARSKNGQRFFELIGESGDIAVKARGQQL